MFYHVYRSYMDNAYPADELMPLSCKGRFRGVTPSRGDMDDILGKYVKTWQLEYNEFQYNYKLEIEFLSPQIYIWDDVVNKIIEVSINWLNITFEFVISSAKNWFDYTIIFHYSIFAAFQWLWLTHWTRWRLLVITALVYFPMNQGIFNHFFCRKLWWVWACCEISYR